MTRFVGFCTAGGWEPGDVLGVLLEEHSTGWVIAAEHISSNESYSKRDITRHYERQAKQGDTLEWAGVVSMQEAAERWTPADHVDGEVTL